MRNYSLFIIIFACYTLLSCKNQETIKHDKVNGITLQSDSLNIVKLTDSLVIYETLCGGCNDDTMRASFDIQDSEGLLKAQEERTVSDRRPGKEDNPVLKTFILVPLNTGSTKLSVSKYWHQPGATEDSESHKEYLIEIRN
jgi:hypothetical protein